MPRTLLVTGPKNFKVTIPDGAKVTFGPWAPPGKKGEWSEPKAAGTLRVYIGSEKNIIGCFSPVYSFRDLSNIGYAEEIAREEGAVMWKDDEKGYIREDKIKREKVWVEAQALPPGPTKKKKGA